MLKGVLRLKCLARENGPTYIAEQYHEPPFHISRPYWDGHALLVQVANPSTGVFAGDDLDVSFGVGPGGRVLVTTPAAASLFPGRQDDAHVRQRLQVDATGALEWSPEPLIPHAGSALEQNTEVELAECATFYGTEIVAPGRVARGEVFAYSRLRLRFSLRANGRLLAKENLRLEPPQTNWLLQRGGWESPYIASIWAVAPSLAPALAEMAREAEAVQTDDVWIGASALPAASGLSVRIIAKESPAMRRTLAEIRGKFSAWMPALKCNTRKL